MSKTENIRIKAANDKGKCSSLALGRSATRPHFVSSPSKITVPQITQRTARSGPPSNKKDVTIPFAPLSSSARRNFLPQPTSLSLGSPLRSAHAGVSKNHQVSSPTTRLEEIPRGPNLSTTRLQLRSQTSKTQLRTNEKSSVGSSKAGSPSVRKTVRIKGLDSLGQSSKHLEHIFFSSFPPKKVPLRGSILPKKTGVECSPFDHGSVSPAPVHLTSPSPHSFIQAQEDESGFSDWEIINWPWVTPYAPATGLNLGLSFSKLQDIFPDFKPHRDQQHYGFRRKKDHLSYPRNKPWERRDKRFSTGISRISNSPAGLDPPFHAGEKIFEDEVKNNFHLAYQVPARRHVEVPNPCKPTKIDPAILSQSPTLLNSTPHYVPRKPAFIKMTSGVDPSQRESSPKVLAKNLVEFAKAISQMKKKDRQVVEKFLDALRNIDVEDEVNSAKFSMRKRRTEGININHDTPNTSNWSLQRKLNPTAPAFSLNANGDSHQTEAEEPFVGPILSSPIPTTPPQKKRVAKEILLDITQMPLQEKNDAGQNLRAAPAAQKQLAGIENRRVDPPIKYTLIQAQKLGYNPARSTEKAQSSTGPKGEPMWVKDIVSAAKKLKQVTKTEPAILESLANENILQLPPFQYPFAELGLPLCAPVDWDHIPGDEGPGRVAQAMDPQWAERRLEKFKEKYPLTGMMKAELGASIELPPISVSKKFASDIQQRLEFVLFQQKEKRALEKLIEELGNTIPSPWE